MSRAKSATPLDGGRLACGGRFDFELGGESSMECGGSPPRASACPGPGPRSAQIVERLIRTESVHDACDALALYLVKSH